MNQFILSFDDDNCSENTSYLFGKAAKRHTAELLTWVNSADQLVEWAGPNMRHPTNIAMLTDDLYLPQMHSFSLQSKEHALLAFGQYYLRLGRCHLCRLIVSPHHRGKSLVKTLIARISAEAAREHGVSSSSLFVYKSNVSALNAYLKMGFAIESYLGADMADNCAYMVKR